jgi:hypothetical protein
LSEPEPYIGCSALEEEEDNSWSSLIHEDLQIHFYQTFLDEYYTLRRITFFFSSFNYINYMVTWVDIAVLRFCLLSDFCELTFCQMSFT